MRTNDVFPHAVRLPDAARLLGVSRTQVFRLVQEGTLATVNRFGGRYVLVSAIKERLKKKQSCRARRNKLLR